MTETETARHLTELPAFRQFEHSVKARIATIGFKRYPRTATVHECRSVADLLWRRYAEPGKITDTRIRWAWRTIKR